MGPYFYAGIHNDTLVAFIVWARACLCVALGRRSSRRCIAAALQRIKDACDATSRADAGTFICARSGEIDCVIDFILIISAVLVYIQCATAVLSLQRRL